MPGAVRMIFPAMGTVNSISIFDAGQQGAAISARDLVMRLERYLSLFRPESELSRFNALPGGTWMPVSEDTFALFCASVHYGRITDGAFDVTAGPLTALWRDAIKEQRIPADSDIISRKRLVDYKAISLDDGQGRVRLRCDGQSVDFGGIAKGYAADRVFDIMHKSAVQNAVINFGGTVGVLGKAQLIGIQHPCRPTGEPMGTLTLQNAFAVTSGGYERGFTVNGERYHHIIDPRSGMPSQCGLLSVTLVGEEAAALDALATAVFVLGAERSLPLLRSMKIEALFVTAEGAVLVTPGLEKSFRLLDQKGA